MMQHCSSPYVQGAHPKKDPLLVKKNPFAYRPGYSFDSKAMQLQLREEARADSAQK